LLSSDVTVPAPIIQLLLATYNDGRYLDDFFNSILSQTETRWSILVRDDGSADGTQERLEEWADRLNGRLVTLPDSGRTNLGVAGNFSRLLAASDDAYVMLANPDDVWHPDKIAISLDAMRKAEGPTAASLPCLVHTDLRIVDAGLREIASSLWSYQGLFPERGHALSRVCVENLVWGCTAMLNRALVDLAGDVPVESHHEDWWLAMVAAAFGQIVSVPVATVDWRRHGSNDSDLSELQRATGAALASPSLVHERLNELLLKSRPRAQVFLRRYGEKLTPRQRAAIEAFIKLPYDNPARRRLSLVQHGLWFTSWRRNLAMLLLV
jgi:glycosyltransferase involved in cell wall biosynthesis